MFVLKQLFGLVTRYDLIKYRLKSFLLWFCVVSTHSEWKSPARARNETKTPECMQFPLWILIAHCKANFLNLSNAFFFLRNDKEFDKVIKNTMGPWDGTKKWINTLNNCSNRKRLVRITYVSLVRPISIVCRVLQQQSLDSNWSGCLYCCLVQCFCNDY